MPKFKMEQSYSLHHLLPHMGVTSIFSRVANLTRLSKGKDIKVSEVCCQFYCATIKPHIFLNVDDDLSILDNHRYCTEL